MTFSESSFKFRKHDLPYVHGILGYNAKVWKEVCPFHESAIKTDVGNIFAGAWILNLYLKMSDYDYYDALTRYKGWSKLGRKQAKDIYIKIKDDV